MKYSVLVAGFYILVIQRDHHMCRSLADAFYSTLQGHVNYSVCVVTGDRGRAEDKGRENENCPPLMANNPVMPVQSEPVTEV